MEANAATPYETDSAAADPGRCPHCRAYHTVPRTPASWKRWGQGYRDARRYFYAGPERSSSADYDAGHCAGTVDRNRKEEEIPDA